MDKADLVVLILWVEQPDEELTTTSELAGWMKQVDGSTERVEGPQIREVYSLRWTNHLRVPTDEWILIEEWVLGGVIGFFRWQTKGCIKLI